MYVEPESIFVYVRYQRCNKIEISLWKLNQLHKKVEAKKLIALQCRRMEESLKKILVLKKSSFYDKEVRTIALLQYNLNNAIWIIAL